MISPGVDLLNRLKMSKPGLIPAGIWNTLIAFLGSMIILPGTGYRIKRVGLIGYTLEILQSAGTSTPWPFKIYNTTKGATGQIQINGGDHSLASINDCIANVNGQASNVATGSPPVYPQLSITGNGVVYIYAVLNADGSVNPTGGSGTGIDVYYAGTLPSADTASPPTYGRKQIGTITGYTVDGSGNVNFTVDDATGPVGVTTLGVCFNTVNFS